MIFKFRIRTVLLFEREVRNITEHPIYTVVASNLAEAYGKISTANGLPHDKKFCSFELVEAEEIIN